MRSFQIHFSQSQNHFLLAFSSYAILFFLFEYFLGQPLSQSYKLVLFESLFFALLGYMMNFSTAFLKSWTVLFLLYESPILVLSQNPQSTLFPRDAVLASGLVLFGYGGSLLLECLAEHTSYKKIITCISRFLFISAIVFPLPTLVYLLISGGKALSSDIMLTLFQTNEEEALAYIKSLPSAALVGSLLLFSLLGALGHDLLKLRQQVLSKKRPDFPVKLIVFLTLCLIIFPVKAKSYSFFVAMKETKEILADYSHYEKSRNERLDRLEQLKGLSVSPKAKGLYVLVIGESATRDHMESYGYKRHTTPFLESFKKDPGTLLFSKAFSNHTHTVPVLTYALSQKNQYNNIPLQKAYSLIEIAKKAGYETYWISNQRKYGAWDTPTSEMAGTADHQVFINGRAGKGVGSTYYDKALLDHVPIVDSAHPTLIVFHVMGSHASYEDRYPKNETYFSGGNNHIDTYDNTILYTDQFLKQLYVKLKKMQDFRGLVYFSDHGEDSRKGIGHNATQYEPIMTHIPFVVHLSSESRKERPLLWQVLQSHKDCWWTNDLLYNFMVTLLGIENAPESDSSLDIASPNYNLPLEKARTLHGKKKLDP
ncbi:arylsulfatase [Acidaminococcus sp. BV3L6]|nr:arylsulfatase [Acidaminococcus sp. BV3L6]RJU34364.1 sulfatase [Acidaminococcus sp. AM33-14BH]